VIIPSPASGLVAADQDRRSCTVSLRPPGNDVPGGRPAAPGDLVVIQVSGPPGPVRCPAGWTDLGGGMFCRTLAAGDPDPVFRAEEAPAQGWAVQFWAVSGAGTAFPLP
jgi:hypothetical protein